MGNSLLSGLAGFLGFLGFGAAADAPRTVEPKPVSAPLVAGAANSVRGTLILLHGGAWRGPDAEHQQRLVRQPGDQLVKQGWRVVSVDYQGGQGGLQNVLDAIGQELLRPSGRLLCIYGESAGGQLALVAAARLPSVNCVIAAGVPTDFQTYFARAAAGGDEAVQYVADTIRTNFGDTPEATAPWDPVRIAGQIEADVLLQRQIGDPLIPAEQVERFRAVRPTTQAVELEAGDPANPNEAWVHGALSLIGRGRYAASIAAFADQALAAHRTTRAASRTGCKGVSRRIARTGPEPFRRALRCLARRTPRASRVNAARRAASPRMRGEVTPARAWGALRSTRAGRRQIAALGAGRARASVRSGDPSLLVVRPRASIRKR